MGGVVALFYGELVHPVDEAGYLALVIQGALHYVQGALEVGGRLGDRLQRGAAAAVVDVVEEPHRMGGLFGVLQPHPVGEAGQIPVLKVGRHRQVDERRLELGGYLVVERFLQSGAQIHRVSSFH